MGNVKAEPGAVVCRTSPSFVRFGTFQLPASRGGLQADMVSLLADYIIENHYPHLAGKGSEVDLNYGRLAAKSLTGQEASSRGSPLIFRVCIDLSIPASFCDCKH